LDEKGIPTPVERTFICPPGSRIGPATDAERAESIRTSNVAGYYEKQVDRESAYEILKKRGEEATAEKEEAEQSEEGFDWGGMFGGGKKKSASRSDGVFEAAAKSAARVIGSEVGRRVIRGVLGSLLKGRR
jgi:hypothetical protein